MEKKGRVGAMEGKEAVEVKKLSKSVKIGKTVYEVTVEPDYLEIEKTVYPLVGYGNNYGSGMRLNLNYSRGWAQVKSYSWANGWAIRGELTGSYEDGVSYIRKSKAREIIEKAYIMLSQAENGTPDVKEVWDKLHEELNAVLEEDF